MPCPPAPQTWRLPPNRDPRPAGEEALWCFEGGEPSQHRHRLTPGWGGRGRSEEGGHTLRKLAFQMGRPGSGGRWGPEKTLNCLSDVPPKDRPLNL